MEPRVGRGISRRRFLAWAGTAAFGAACGVVAWETRTLRIVRTEVTIGGLGGPFDGLRIVHLSDFHRGRLVGEDLIRRAGDLARSLEPDLVVLTGDFVTGKASYAWSCMEALGHIPSAFGTFAVMGNHDWWTNNLVVRQAVEHFGCHVLSNDAVRLSLEGGNLWLLGVEDMWSSAYSLARAVYVARPPGPRILLCHNPDVFPTAVAWGIDLVLSGHTHGGQVCLPFVGPLLLPIRTGKKLAAGTHRVGRSWIHVTRGVGVVAPPVRFHCPPDVSLITLRAVPSVEIA